MRLNRKLRWLAIVPAVILFGTGCSGISTTQTISPLMFFLPGLVEAAPEAAVEQPIVSIEPFEPGEAMAHSQ